MKKREVVFERGYYWHAPCVDWIVGHVNFPSRGQLIPLSIMADDPKSKILKCATCGKTFKEGRKKRKKYA